MKWIVLVAIGLGFSNPNLTGKWHFDAKTLDPLIAKIQASAKNPNMVQFQIAMIKQQVEHIFLEIQKDKMILHSPMGIDSIDTGASSWKGDTLKVTREGKSLIAIHNDGVIQVTSDEIPMPVVLRRR